MNNCKGNVTDTPRTDAAKKDDWVHYTVAMMLERELTESNAEVERLTENAQRIGVNRYQQICKAEAEVERLKALPHSHHESFCRKCGSTEMVTETTDIK